MSPTEVLHTPAAVLVEHSHLDREWYRTAEAFRARLVDALDSLLDTSDPERVFTLDGQVVPVEDYLELRPERRAELCDAIREGQLVIGPWYVQADGFVPSDESIVRNLLEGAAAAAPFGPTSSVAYLPDTFGHPAGLPTILAGAGLRAFCFSRGESGDVATDQFRWIGPDGSSVVALRLRGGYHNAAHLPADPQGAGRELVRAVETARRHAADSLVVLMAGHDHVLPASFDRPLAAARDLGVPIERASIDRFAEFYLATADSLPAASGEFRICGSPPILQNVLSTRVRLKLANARCEAMLTKITEPLAAAALGFGGSDERPALRSARRELLHNQAHDSICGTSIDPVHREMEVRFRRIEDRLTTTAERLLARLSTDNPSRPGRCGDELQLVVFNPADSAYTGPVECWFDADPPYAIEDGKPSLPELLKAVDRAGSFMVDGKPAQLLERPNRGRFAWESGRPDRGVRFLARSLPPFSWTAVKLEILPRSSTVQTVRARRIATEDLAVEAAADGSLAFWTGDRRWAGLFGLHDEGDAGDSYDAAVVGPAIDGSRLVACDVIRDGSGIEQMIVDRRITVPVSLASNRLDQRATECVDLPVKMAVSLCQGSQVARVSITAENTAMDHRLRLRFPFPEPIEELVTAGQFHVMSRSAPEELRDPIPVQGAVWEPRSGLGIVAPGLLEWAVYDGGIEVTLVRSVGWLSHEHVPGRGPLGPTLSTPDAQVPGWIEASIFLIATDNPQDVWRLNRHAAIAPVALVADNPGAGKWPAEIPLFDVDSDTAAIITAIKPHEYGTGIVVRLWNPTDQGTTVRLAPCFPFSGVQLVNLLEGDVTHDGSTRQRGRRVEVGVPPHAIRSLLFRHEVAGEGRV